MFKKLWLLPVWSGVSGALLMASVFMYVKMDEPVPLASPLVSEIQPTGVPELMYAAIPAPENKFITSIGTADARAEILRQYLAKHESPLEPYADLIVKVSDENGFDFRWLVAIAQQESNLCKRIPDDSYNCWGWGIWCLDYDSEANECREMKITRFESYEQAIERIAPQFKEKFLSKGSRTEAEEVMGTYTPPSDGSWAFGVNQFMSELE